MKRTTVYLAELTDLELTKLARQRGQAKAELIREALERYLQEPKLKRPMPDWVGMGRSGDGRFAMHDEDLMADLLAEDYERLMKERQAGS